MSSNNALLRRREGLRFVAVGLLASPPPSWMVPCPDHGRLPEKTDDLIDLGGPCADSYWDGPEGNALVNRWIAGEASREEEARLDEARRRDQFLEHKVAVMMLLAAALRAMNDEAVSDEMSSADALNHET